MAPLDNNLFEASGIDLDQNLVLLNTFVPPAPSLASCMGAAQVATCVLTCVEMCVDTCTVHFALHAIHYTACCTVTVHCNVRQCSVTL